MTITRTITRTMIPGEWALWVESGRGTVAVLMDRDNGTQVWIETDASTATAYGRQYGWARTARIVSAPITIDTTPAGIFAAMMRANASESAAPQSRLYGLLSDYLRRTLAAEYGTVAAEHIYQTAMSSGEFNEETIPYGLASVQYGRTEDVTARDLRTGDTVDTDMGPVLLVKDNGARGLLSVRNFTGRILSVPSVPDHCTWVLRSNVSAGQAIDYWAVQGTPARLFRRYSA
jgi:hypothetical protein